MTTNLYPLNTEAWSEWVEYRRKMKKKIGPRAIVSQPAMLQQYPPEDQRRILEFSMDNDYQGLFPDEVIHRRPSSTRHNTLAHDLYSREWAK